MVVQAAIGGYRHPAVYGDIRGLPCMQSWKVYRQEESDLG
jgi:hypothetical protein